MNLIYPAKITKDDNRFLVKFIDLPEAITEGETMEEALFNASEVLTLTLVGRSEENIDIPMPSKVKEGGDIHLVAPCARVQSALLLRRARQNISLSDLARTLNSSWPSAARLEDPSHWPSLRQLERAAAALGKRVVISLV